MENAIPDRLYTLAQAGLATDDPDSGLEVTFELRRGITEQAASGYLTPWRLAGWRVHVAMRRKRVRVTLDGRLPRAPRCRLV